MAAMYTKLRDGSWGARVQGSARAGQVVTVTKKNGQLNNETIDRVLWEGRGVSICSIVPRSAPAPRGPFRNRGYRSGVGSAAPVQGYSSYCTGRENCGCYDCSS